MGKTQEEKLKNAILLYGTIEKWDSLMHMRMVMEIEEEYDVEIPIEEIPNIKTLKDFYKYIEG